MSDVLAPFTREPFTHDGVTHDLYVAGRGPGVVVMPEIPGITPTVAAFALRVAARGFTVFVADLFGTPGAPRSAGAVLRSLAHVCVSREFTVLARRRSSPVTGWLRAVCREAHRRCGGPGVGAIGMCITGNFALSLMVDPSVMAPVLSQPSTPFPVSPGHCRDLSVSDEELAAIQARDVPVLGLRFTHDRTCPGARFTRLREVLGDRFVGVEIDSSWGNPWGHPPWAHSVVTEDLIDAEGQPTRAALEQVLAFFERQLRPPEVNDAGAR